MLIDLQFTHNTLTPELKQKTEALITQDRFITLLGDNKHDQAISIFRRLLHL